MHHSTDEDGFRTQRETDEAAADTEQQLPRFLGLDRAGAEALGRQLGIEPWFNDADDPVPERLVFRSRGVRLYLRNGLVVSGNVG